jgi:alpha-tubulin suppressor-like RCC1 family protein/predicted thioesterase
MRLNAWRFLLAATVLALVGSSGAAAEPQIGTAPSGGSEPGLLLARVTPPGVAPIGSRRAIAASPARSAAGTSSMPVTVTAISPGLDHGCLLTSSGGVKCWGSNDSGQLGDGSILQRSVPTDVEGLASGAAAVSAGARHTCALTSTGGVKCWGSGDSGLLGDGSFVSSLTPVDVVGLTSGVQAVAAASLHTCALTLDGGVKCWGANFAGQLGDGTLLDRNTPVDVVGLASGVEAIAVGGFHSCALMAGGAVKCWGGNGQGELGDDSTIDRSTPVDVIGLSSGVTSISAGEEHSCALLAGGGLRCWGSNLGGRIGDGSTIDRPTPVDVVGLPGIVVAVAAGGSQTCALLGGGAVKCWGLNFDGQVGDGSTVDRTAPVDVVGLSAGVQAIAAGTYHTCAVMLSGGAKCWGGNESGELGDGQPGDRRIPEPVFGLANDVTAISAGDFHGCAVAGGAVKCWGANFDGQLGDGTTTDSLAPVDVVGLSSGVAAVSASGLHSCALLTNGGVKCWGNNSWGQLGDGSYVGRTTPVVPTGMSAGVAAIAAGADHTCVLMASGAVRCWGRNDTGQVGDGTPLNRNAAVDVDGLSSGATGIAGGLLHTCGIVSGAAKCWGENSVGQLGDGTTDSRFSPVAVFGLGAGMAAIAAGGTHSCAVTSGGAAKCWGENLFGSVGDGSRLMRLTPVDVTGLSSGVTAISAGGSHSCALSGGNAQCWGWNFSGELGDDSRIDRLEPVAVSGLAGPVTAIAASWGFTCAVDDGVAKCWGANYHGQLGIGIPTFRSTPVDVVGFSFDAVPDPFAFVSETGVLAGSVRTSNAITPAGYDSPTPISVSNGEHSIGCTATFTSAADMLTPGESVCVRHTASMSPGTTVTTTLTIGGVAGSFSSTTASAAPDTTPDPFGFTAQAGVAAGSVRTSNAITPVGYDAETVITVSNGEHSIGCTATFTSAADMLTPGESVCVRHTASMSAGTTVTTTLTIGGVAGTFSSTTAGVMAPPLSFTPNPLDFDGQSMFTRSLKRQVTIGNVTGSALTLNALATDGPFAIASHTCGTLPAQLPAGGSCTAELSFTPPDEGPFAGSLDAATSAGDASGALMGTGERSLVVHYYGSILNRYPEPSGKTYWNSEAARVQALGADLNEVWYALAMGFFNSVEYIGFGRTDGEFIDDLYRTFLNREPEAAGRDFWLGLIAQGLTREVVLVWFMFSDEFRVFTSSIFGATAVRKELDAVMDFYRGLLLRLPDGGGFNYWVARFRAAQCAGAAAVTAEAEAISGEFARGAEYANRNRTDSEYVGDLYNAILRRGGDGPGVQYWIGSIACGALTREQVRQQFVQSPEFQARVQQIIAAGCLPP